MAVPCVPSLKKKKKLKKIFMSRLGQNFDIMAVPCPGWNYLNNITYAIHNTLKPKHDNDYNNWNTSYSLKISYIIFILEWFPVEWRNQFLKIYNIDQECLFLQVSKLWKSAFAKFTNFQYFRVPMAPKKIPESWYRHERYYFNALFGAIILWNIILYTLSRKSAKDIKKYAIIRIWMLCWKTQWIHEA